MNPSEKFDILGVELEWKLTAAETDHQYCVLEAVLPPGVVVPPHRHPEQEAFFILEGAPEFVTSTPRGLEWCFAVPGETINVNPMSIHGFRNPTHSDVRMLITCPAALGNFFHEAGLPILHGSPYRFTVPAAEQIARVMVIAERMGHSFSSEKPGQCGSAPHPHALGRLLSHPTRSSVNRAYLF
ncbi:MAG: cupin domain-containing protein [Edaphobacter sp.]|uniref:cupin domain-containing protein n=1 Tax=Edaphobacter sp. TaxID=1934404 RepID=UPI002388F8C6|nr:cupin domain-containing protein [Edaphobacter sp.]MDE1176968.1 cupin domain-containing protein [Edaphobacter sp.]